MERFTIPVLGCYCEGGTEKAMLAGGRLSRFKVGWFSRQIRETEAEA